MDYKKHLKELRNKLASNQMSLMAGSGLSRNVSEHFLVWDELLIDLAYELNQHDLDTEYAIYQTSGEEPLLPKEKFVAKECKSIIQKQGYLEIVSAYIQWKGYAESIATYIEQRIPGITENNGEYILDVNGKTEKLSWAALALHRALVDLPWNNIYTTNYDDLLDVCIDQDRYERLNQEIVQLQHDITRVEIEKMTREAELESLSGSESQSAKGNNSTDPIENLEEFDVQSVKNNRDRKFKLGWDVSSLRRELQELENLLRGKTIEMDSCYQVVKSASGLRIKKQKNIIKLHGSLRTKQERDNFFFEFDGDHKKQYVIAREDYTTYPERHEAFTQLMRISLLQESFCLIGFSGWDPNYLEWIHWVRDILHKAARQDRAKQQYKIYLIETDDEPLTADRQLFYENHNIVRIPLRSPDVIAFLETDLNKKLNFSDRRSTLEAFIDFLNNDEHIRVDVPTANISVRQEYIQIWEKLKVFDREKPPQAGDLAKAAERLAQLEGSLWLPSLDYSHINGPHSFIQNINSNSWRKALEEQQDMLHVLKYALQALYLPIHNTIEQSIIDRLLANGQTAADTSHLLSRNYALSANQKSLIPAIKEEVLRLAYSFQFKALIELLEQWEAKDRDLVFKAGFLALVKHDKASEMLSAAIWSDSLKRGEEMLYGLELLHYITQPRIRNGDKRIGRLIDAYERSGYKLLQDTLKQLHIQVEKKREKLTPYGKRRFTKVRSNKLEKFSATEAAVQMLMVLAESGFQLTLANVYILSHESWYDIHREAFRFYPAAFLFYSLQYGNEDFLKKVGQDYAYSEESTVINDLPEICSQLFSSLGEAPQAFQDHAQVFLSSLVVGVSPRVWQVYFGNWWRQLRETGALFLKGHGYHHSGLIVAAIRYIEDQAILREIVEDCLTAALSDKPDSSINYLYYLNRNIYFKQMSGVINELSGINTGIDRILDAFNDKTTDLIFVLGNLHHFMSADQVTSTRRCLETMALNEVKGARVWRIITYFADGQVMLKHKIKAAIIENRKLWHTGIKGTTVYGSLDDEPIPISALSSPALGEKGLIWEDEEIDRMYERLKPELDAIQRLGAFREPIISFTGVLEEMVEFLSIYQPVLSKYATYNQDLTTAQHFLELQRNYHDIEEGLTSKEHNEVLTALAELSVRIFESRFEREHVSLVLNKILLQSDPALEASLNYLVTWLTNKNYPDCFRDMALDFVRVLKRYGQLFPEGSDVAFVEENLMRIAWQLNQWRVQHTAVQDWLTRGKISRFNNVRQFLEQAGEIDWLTE